MLIVMGSSTGQININLSNIIDNLFVDFIDPTGSYVLNDIPVTSSALVFSNVSNRKLDSFYIYNRFIWLSKLL
jgi:hypothetical protein